MKLANYVSYPKIFFSILTKINRQFFHPNLKVKKQLINVHGRISRAVVYHAAA